MISTEGMLTVNEAAKRLRRSTEQVRRYLREGKIKGQRVGNQWFVEEATLAAFGRKRETLIPRAQLEQMDGTREAIFRRNGIVFDVVEMLRRDRETH